ncbi:hypothetical protein [Aurantiacibacter zhengii]|uniref:Uncharacterized protein n=1 Tax=Aurantiacibacter zhengii TaxID=2307003 RepID=A0A418NXD9_9SPHN|nr:hypothetical protein [Aurantiacibacter zhengii]RIV89277.1 hypothetical protein D2V07_03305 [Aurantiacibacter zhengii]
MSVHEALDRLEETYRLMVSATLSDRLPDAAEILALRQRFAIEFGNLMLALKDDLKGQGNHSLHDEVLDRLKTLRIRLMSYTLAWQPAQIEEDPLAYREAAEGMAEMVQRFITDTRTLLKHAASGRDRGEP